LNGARFFLQPIEITNEELYQVYSETVLYHSPLIPLCKLMCCILNVVITNLSWCYCD